MPRLQPVGDAGQLEDLVQLVFADPEARRGMGWTEQDDPGEALDRIGGLWHHRFEGGWTLWRIERAGAVAGLAGLGPGPGDGEPPWVAVYLLERGRGIGRWTTQRLLQHAGREGHDRVRAVTWAENRGARGLLEATGFELVGPADYAWAEQSGMAWLVYERPV